MIVGIVTAWFDRGASMVSKAYKEVLENRGYKVFVYARGGEKQAKNDLAWDGPEVTWQSPRNAWDPTAIEFPNFRSWVKKNNINVVVFNEQQYWPSLVRIRQELPWLVIGSYIDYYTEVTVPYFELFDFLICNTKRHFGVFSWHANAHYLPWGTDIHLFSPRPVPKKSGELTFFSFGGHESQQERHPNRCRLIY